jgi:hypothetical protein
MDTADRGLPEVLDWLAAGSSVTPGQADGFMYLAGPDLLWGRAEIQRDLWRRACSVASRGLITFSELRLWGHWHGVIDGHRWSKAEIRRRLGFGRDQADRVLAMVTDRVAQTYDDQLLPVRSWTGRADVETTDLQEATAAVIGRSASEGRRHQAETFLSVHDLLRGHIAPPTGHVRLTSSVGKSKRNLKTTRHTDVALSQWHRAVLDATARRLGLVSESTWPGLPLWQPAEPTTFSLEQSYRELLRLMNGRDRRAIADILRVGHHQLTHGQADRELVIEFLVHEVAILRDSYNLMALPVLEILEHLLPASDHRRVILARDRAHLLEVHHFLPAAGLWLGRAAARLNDERTRWPGRDAKLLNATNISIRLLSVRIDQSVTSGEISLPGQRTVRTQIRSMLEGLERSSLARGEWIHLADRHDLQLLVAVKGIERRGGVGTGWADADLLRLEAMDRDVAGLDAPARELAWQARKLSVLLEADQHSEFVAVAQRAIPAFERYGPAWPNQIAALRVVLESAMRRRSKAWAGRRHDIHDLTLALPEDTDDLLRHRLAIPRPLIIRGTPIF